MIFKFIINKISKNKLKSFLIIFNIFIIIFFSCLLIFFYDNIEKYFVKRFVWTYEDNKFEIISKKQWNIFNLKWDNEEISLDQDFQNLSQDSNIQDFYKFYIFRYPVSIEINLLWQSIQTDIFVFVADDAAFSKFGVNPDEQKIPVWISSSLLDFYNMQVAGTSVFPKVSQDMLRYVNLNILFGKSTFIDLWQSNIISKQAEVKLSDTIFPMIGITIPYSNFENLNLSGDQNISLYRAVGYVKDSNYISTIEQKYWQNYTINFPQKSINQIRQSLFVVRLIFIAVVLVALFIFFNFIVYSVYFMIDTNKEIFNVFRLHWANKFTILKIILYEEIFYMFWAFVLLVLSNLIWWKYVVVYINTLLSQKYFINFNFENLSNIVFYLVVAGYMVLILFVVWLVSFREWNKKFLN